MPKAMGIILFWVIAIQAMRLLLSDSLGMVACGVVLLVLLPTFLIFIDREQSK